MKGLFLFGLGCTNEIWSELKTSFVDMDIKYVEYPHEITKEAKSVSKITKWVFGKYGEDEYDFIVGHSLGGIIALELVSKFNVQCKKVIFIDSSLKPAGVFYRNLLTHQHMNDGQKVLDMINKEIVYYSKSVIDSVQQKFDYTGYIKNTDCKIYGIYGDRGKETYANRIIDLRLDDETIKKIDFRFIKESCHMPMIENPTDLQKMIVDILRE